MKGTLLEWDVYVAPGIPVVSDDLPPDETQMLWSPTSSTLIYGERDAVLVDALLTVKEAEALVTWIDVHDKRLTTIYATHGHGDHCFGASVVLQRFRSARFVATTGVITIMREQASPETLKRRWRQRFPGQVVDHPVIAVPLQGNTIDLEGHELIPIEVGHTDTDNTTCLHVPDLGLVVAGDVVYNDVHVYLGE
ncbi:MAG TPA: MBL fold metallo-hydrolase, partial [Gemmatimonadaceae bacterium]